MPQLFSYGTIQDPMIQQKIIGRTLEASPDKVSGFKLSNISIDQKRYPILIPDATATDSIKGSVYKISESELKAFDDYEGPDYQKSLLPLESGMMAWVYHQ